MMKFKAKKKYYIVTAASVIVIFGTLLYFARPHRSDNAHEEVTDILRTLPTTEEERLVYDQNYLAEKIEETLNGYAFESDEEKNHYREILLEHYQN